MKEYVFIFGAGRTGTTLAARILGKSPKVSIYQQESHAFLAFWQPGNKLALPENVKNADDFAEYVLQKFPKINFGWTQATEHEKLLQLVHQIKQQQFFPQNAASFLNFLLEQNIDEGVRYYGEKTPAHVYYYKELISYFKPCKIIFTIRDPRATAYSEQVKKDMKHLGLAPFNILVFVVRFVTVYTLVNAISKMIGAKNVHIIRYEDIVQQPETSIKQLCEFMDIAFSEEMLKVGVFNSSFGDKFQTDKNFNLENIDRWKQELLPSYISIIEKSCKTIMQKYGYEVSTLGDGTSLTLFQQLKLMIAKFVVQIMPSYFHYKNKHQKYKLP